MEFASWFTILLLGIIIWLCWCSFDDKEDTLGDVPGPKGWPIVGNLLQIPSQNAHFKFIEWAKEFGPVFKVKIGSKFHVVVNNLDSIHEVFVTKGDDFSGKASGIRRDETAGLFNQDLNDQVKLTRKVVYSSFKAFGSGMGKIENLAAQHSSDMIDAFEKSNGIPIDPEDELFYASFSMMTVLLFGEAPEKGSESYENILKAGEHLGRALTPDFYGLLLDAFPSMSFLGSSVFKHVQLADEYMAKVWQSEVMENINSLELDTYSDDDCIPTAHSMIEYDKKMKGTMGFSDAHKRKTCMEVFMAGVFTVHRSMLALLNILVHYSEIQNKIYEEIDAVLGDRAVSYLDRVKLPFTCATILELHRYASILPLNAPRKCVRDSQILGYTIRKNTEVVANFWALHHDKDFSDKSFEFRPQRFLDVDGQLVAEDHPNQKHIMPFAAGPRICLGMNVAQVRIFLWIVSILQRFELMPDKSSPLVPCDPRSYLPQTISRPQSYKIRFVPRRKR